jgi:hypothetical protein
MNENDRSGRKCKETSGLQGGVKIMAIPHSDKKDEALYLLTTASERNEC